MPRTLHLFGAAVAAAPLAALSLSLLTTPTLSPATSIATVRAPITAAITPTPSVATALTARPALSASALALAPSSALTRFSPASVAAARLYVSPGLQLRLDARQRASDYLDLVATDQGPFGPHRSLADTIAWMSRGVRATTQDPFGPPPLDRIRPKVTDACGVLAARSDAHPPDFDANDLVRLLYLYPPAPLVLATPTVVGAAVAPAAPATTPATTGPTHRLPRDVGAQIRTALRSFKFAIDEGGPDDICFWSENHQILFPTAEYLAGQLMPNEWFPNGRMWGRDHKAKARPRLLRWLDERLKFGWSEWNSPGYYEEHFKALFNLVDFCDDPQIKKRATMCVDLLVFDLARFTQQGSFGVTAGRCYQKVGGDGSQWKHDGWRQSVGELIQILFGTRGRFSHSGAVGALYFATATYEPPPVLLAIGQDRPDHFVDRSRVSIDFDEARDWGIGFTGTDDTMFWWSKSAYMAKQTIASTRWMFRTHGVTRLRNDVADALGFAYPAFEAASDSQLYSVANAASPITEGMCLTKANLYTFRNRDVMLSSVQDYRRGQIGPQQHPWQATLGMKAVVYTTLPGKRESDGPGYWTGNAAMPSVVQHEGAAIIAYDAPLITKVKEGLHRTHAWFPRGEFDEFDRRRGSNLHGAYGVTSDGTWIFGRKGDGYVALYSNEGFGNGPDDWVAAGSWTNVFVCQVGNAAEFGSFQAFKDQVTRARIYVHYPRLWDSSPVYCGYDIPGGKGRLELHYGGQPRLNGQVMSVHDFPRYDNPYAYVPWGMPSYAIRHRGFELIHFRDARNAQDPRADTRIVR